MALNTIKVNDDLSVIVTFEVKHRQQLTKRGLHDVEVIVAEIARADGLGFLASGIAIQQPDDVWDFEKGAKLALGRAINDLSLMYGLTPADRRNIYTPFVDEFQRRKVQAKAEYRAWKKQLQGLIFGEPLVSIDLETTPLPEYRYRNPYGWGV